MKLEKGTTISHYKILSEIGKGGMGEVYLAQDTKLNRKVAIKFLSDEFSKDTDKLNRFVQEAQAASALNHPNIITIHEIGEIDGTNYIATEFIEGETLNKYLKGKDIKLGSVLDIAIQVASALDEAHAAGIVHRDIKPDNIMIRSNGLVKILDFGIAKLTEQKTPEIESEDATAIQISTTPGIIIGTANYMSPEQAKGKEVDKRTDIFSFGVVLYEMISRHLPFEGETAMEMIGAIIHKNPKPLGEVHPDLEEIITKTLKKNRNERYQNSKELLEDLQNLKKRIEFEAELERTSSPDKKAEAQTQIFKANTTEEKKAIHTASNRNSIAVMPFEHLSSDEDNEYFCDGLAEELINALTKVNRIEVAARSSSFSFKGKNASVSEISETLNVRNILEGSVRKSGDRLRISVQLVNATDGYQIWSERYDREMKDVFDVQDEIAFAVVDALKVKLLGGEKEAVLKRYTSNPEAYQLYLQGRFFFSKRTPKGFDKAIEYFKRAIEIDSEYAIAYSGMVDCYVILGFYELLPTAEAERLSVPLAQKAIQIDDSIAEVWASKALSTFFGDLSESDEHYQKAISLNPKYAATYHFRSTTLILMGRLQEAIESSKRAIELEPFAIGFNSTLAWWYYLSGRNDEAIKQAQKSIEIAPHFLAYWVLGLTFSQIGKFTKAISNMQTARDLSGNMPNTIAELAWIYTESGEKDKARELLDELKQLSKREYVSPTNFAKIYLGLGETQKAFEEIEKAFEKSAFRLAYFLVDPIFDPYRSEPLIQDILRRLNMPTDEITKETDDKLEAKTIALEPKTSGEHKKRRTISAGKNKRSKNTTKRDWKIAGIISLLIVVFGIFGYYLTADSSDQIESIAVMPFVNESGNEDVEYLSDGMTETLISNLTKIPNLSVKARSSVFYYKGKDAQPSEIGKKLGVETVLLGRITQRGEDLKLNLELVNTDTLDAIWSETYNRKIRDLVSLQSEIADDVSTKLRIKLSNKERERVIKPATSSSAAQQLYLKGRFHWNKRSLKELDKAADYFQKAIDKDPNYSLAYTGLADTYGLMPVYGRRKPNEYYPKAKKAALKALEIDGNSAEAHASLGQILAYTFDLANAEREYKRAIEIDPKYPSAHQWYAELLIWKRSDREALKEIDIALKLDPFSAIINTIRGIILTRMRRFDDAVAQFKKTIDLFPDFTFARSNYGDCLAAAGKPLEGIEQHLIAFKMNNGDKTGEIKMLEDAYKTGIWQEYWRAVEKMLIARRNSALAESPNTYIGGDRISRITATLGNRGRTLKYLKEAYSERETELVVLRAYHYYDFLSNDPEYRELLRKIGTLD